MENEINDFVEALARFVEQELSREPDPVYSQKAVKIDDARNHIFRMMELYALADLCRMDEDSLQAVPNRGRMLRIARNYWN